MDLQNRLGFVVAPWRGNLPNGRTAPLSSIFASGKRHWERSRLVRQDVVGHRGITETEIRWLRANRSEPAAHWNVLNLTAEHLRGME